MNEFPYDDIVDIETPDNLQDVKNLLDSGEWKFLKSHEILGYTVVEEPTPTIVPISKVIFVMGKVKKEEPKPTERPVLGENPFKNARWRESKYETGGFFLFAGDTTQDMVKMLQGGEIDDGEYFIHINKNGTILRSPKK